MLTIKPEDHRSGSRGRHLAISVDFADASPRVELHLEAADGETFDDSDVDRYLTPDEARALAAALWHIADEVDRRYRS